MIVRWLGGGHGTSCNMGDVLIWALTNSVLSDAELKRIKSASIAWHQINAIRLMANGAASFGTCRMI
jgi:hypothetical protein